MSVEKFGSVGPVVFQGVSSVVSAASKVKHRLGERVVFEGNEYCYVYNAGGAEIDQYHGCVLSAVSGYSVTVSSVSAVSPLFGVAAHVTIPTANYGWVLTKGIANVANDRDDSALTAGGTIYLGADGRFDSVDNIGTQTNVTIAPTCGHMLFAPSSGTTGTSYALAYVHGG